WGFGSDPRAGSTGYRRDQPRGEAKIKDGQTDAIVRKETRARIAGTAAQMWSGPARSAKRHRHHQRTSLHGHGHLHRWMDVAPDPVSTGLVELVAQKLARLLQAEVHAFVISGSEDV